MCPVVPRGLLRMGSLAVILSLFFACLCAFSSATSLEPAFNFTAYPECNPKNETAKSIPKLAEEFTIRVEGKTDEDGKMTDFFDSEGYYEKDGERGATVVYDNGDQSTFLYDFITGDAYNIDHSGMCVAAELFEHGCNAYAVFIAETVGHSNVSTECNITAGYISYRGDKDELNATLPLLIRALPAKRWTQCLYDGKQAKLTVNDFYFTADDIKAATPAGVKDVPLRFVSRQIPLNSSVVPLGKMIGHTYDFTSYTPAVKDDDVFLPPSGVFCPTWMRENRTMPTLPDQISLTMLTVSQVGQQINNLRLNFDYKKELVSFISDNGNGSNFPPVSRDSKGKSLNRTIHDFSSGLSFSQPYDKWSSGSKTGCLIQPIGNCSLDTKDDAKNGSVHIRHADALFGLNRKGWTYIGQKNFSGMPCALYAREKNDTKAVTVTEAYWVERNWTSGNSSVLVGLVIHQKAKNGTLIETYTTTVSDYNAFPFQFRLFDISACIKADQPLVVVFDVKFNDYTEAVSRYSNFQDSFRDALAELLATSSLRLVDFVVTKGGSANEGHVWLTILEWTTVQGRPDAPKQKPSADVAKDLQDRLTGKNVEFNIIIAKKNQTVTLLKDTLKFGSDLVAPATQPPPTTPAPPGPPAQIVQEGYTSGSMAGLAFAMIIIGSVAGLVAGFLLWKRNTGIAYQVYD